MTFWQIKQIEIVSHNEDDVGFDDSDDKDYVTGIEFISDNDDADVEFTANRGFVK